MEANKPQDALGFLEVAVDDALQVRHAAEAPVLEVRSAQELHADEDVDRCNYFARSKQLIDSANDPTVVGILPVVSLGDLPHRVRIQAEEGPVDAVAPSAVRPNDYFRRFRLSAIS